MIGAAVGAAGAIAGGIMRNRAIAEARAELDKRERENADWYNRRYNEDATMRADAQRAITRTEEAMKERNRAAQGVAAVMGGSQDAVLAAQKANADAVTDTVSAIAAKAADRKDAVEAQFRAEKSELSNIRRGEALERANAIAEATQGVTSAAASLSDAFGGRSDIYDLKKEGV